MKLKQILCNGAEFMDWLANNCYNCKKLGDGATQYNPECKLEPVLSYSDLMEDIDEEFLQMIIQDGKLCKCRKFEEI